MLLCYLRRLITEGKAPTGCRPCSQKVGGAGRSEGQNDRGRLRRRQHFPGSRAPRSRQVNCGRCPERANSGSVREAPTQHSPSDRGVQAILAVAGRPRGDGHARIPLHLPCCRMHSSSHAFPDMLGHVIGEPPSLLRTGLLGYVYPFSRGQENQRCKR